MLINVVVMGEGVDVKESEANHFEANEGVLSGDREVFRRNARRAKDVGFDEDGDDKTLPEGEDCWALIRSLSFYRSTKTHR